MTESTKLKIAQVIDDTLDSTDGVQQIVLAVGAWLAEQGHEVHYITSSTTRTEPANIHSIAGNMRFKFNGNRVGIPKPASRSKVKQLLAEQDFDVVHVQVPYSPLLAGRIISALPERTALVGTFMILPLSLAYLVDASGVDIYEVITAAGYKYDRLKLALPGPVAGPCLEKDAYILADSAQFFDTEVPLSLAGRSANEKIVTHVGQTAQVLIDQPQRAAIIGLAFKGRPATSDTRGSLAGNFAGRFRELWPALDIVGWDPLVSPEDSAEMNITFTHLPEAVSGANLVLLQSNHPDFTSEQFVEVLAANIPDGAVVIDLWNQTEALAKARPDLKIAVLGRLSEVNK